ncbi:MAG: 50S ribosomal protein L10 [Rikenellaceae bacterium]
MDREQKKVVINSLAEKLQEFPHYYITDTSTLNAEQTASLRRKCYEQEVTLIVAKNTLFIKALEQVDMADQDIVSTLKGTTAIMFTHVAKAPAKLIKEFRKEGNVKPSLKAAWAEGCAYVGEESLESLVNIKSRDELIGDIIGLLQSPMKNVVSALQGASGQKIAGLVKTLEERAQ